MRELQAQSLVVKAVNGRGGKAFKMANRFLVGVVDLFVQMPGCPTYVWEVKLNKRSLKTDVPIDLTAPQEKFLRDVIKAGGKGGVISFVQDGNELWFAAVAAPMRSIIPSLYRNLQRGNRENQIVDTLYSVSHAHWRDT